ncbi:hypothetical protein GCM10023238_39040 [Streptomyces heliomycini]
MGAVPDHGDMYPRMRVTRRRGSSSALTVASARAVLGVGGWGTLQLSDVFPGGDDPLPRAAQSRLRDTVSRTVAPKPLPARDHHGQRLTPRPRQDSPRRPRRD